MVFLLPFHTGDVQAAEAWLRWSGELGGCKAHSLILMPARQIADIAPLRELAEAAFGEVSVLPDAEGISGHPEGPNSMMRQAVWHCQIAGIGPWTFIEPDCIPLVPDWADQWEREYRAYGKPFMGELRPANGNTPDYLTGNMVLPKDAITLAPMLTRRGLSLEGVELAFDIVSAAQVLPQAHFTKLLQQIPKREDGASHHFPDQESLKILRPGAVMFHPCRDFSLIDRLRERRALTGAVNRIISHAATIEEPKPERIGTNPLAIENARLLTRISELEALISKNGHSKPKKKKRSAIEQAKINVRMAKLRERKLAKA